MKNYKYNDGLESARIITRNLVLEDYAVWTRFFEDREAIEYLPAPADMNPEERSKAWINKQLNRYAGKTFGLQGIIDKKSGEFIGQCGLLGQEVDGIKEVEVGYHILRKNWGRGYAPEAARLFINYAFENDLSDSVISIIHIDNIKSQRVAEKNGLKREKVTKWNDLEVAIYRISKSDFNNT